MESTSSTRVAVSCTSYLSTASQNDRPRVCSQEIQVGGGPRDRPLVIGWHKYFPLKEHYLLALQRSTSVNYSRNLSPPQTA
jgi:hypothetical protein